MCRFLARGCAVVNVTGALAATTNGTPPSRVNVPADQRRLVPRAHNRRERHAHRQRLAPLVRNPEPRDLLDGHCASWLGADYSRAFLRAPSCNLAHDRSSGAMSIDM